MDWSIGKLSAKLIPANCKHFPRVNRWWSVLTMPSRAPLNALLCGMGKAKLDLRVLRECGDNYKESRAKPRVSCVFGKKEEQIKYCSVK